MTPTQIKHTMRRLHATPLTLAIMIGVSPATIYNWLSGRTKPHPTFIRSLKELAEQKGTDR